MTTTEEPASRTSWDVGVPFRIAIAVPRGLVVAYLLFWPVPAEPVSWQAHTRPGFIGVFAPNTRLSGLRIINVGNEVGPEHIAIAPDGGLYAAMASGNVLRGEIGRD